VKNNLTRQLLKFPQLFLVRTLKNQGQTEVDDKQLDLNNNNAAEKKQNRQEDAQKSRFPT
jgi:hypothetical protein